MIDMLKIYKQYELDIKLLKHFPLNKKKYQRYDKDMPLDLQLETEWEL